MTNAKMDLQTPIQKADDGDFLRELIGYAAQQLMDLEVEAVTGAGYGERSPQRQTRRNGYREIANGRPARVPWTCRCPSRARAPASRASWSRAGPPKRRSWR